MGELRECLPEALEFFEDAFSKGRPHILVHCQKGISRSTSVVLAWLMRSKGYSFDVAWKKAESKRKVAFPNIGFQVQLRTLEAFGKEKGKDADLSTLDQSSDKVSAVIAADAGKRLADLDAMFEKCMTDQSVLHERETWKRYGLFFENVHKYNCILDIGSEEPLHTVVDKVEEVAGRLEKFGNVFNPKIPGVKFAAQVAKEMRSWVSTNGLKVRLSRAGEEAKDSEKDAATDGKKDKKEKKEKKEKKKDKKEKKENKDTDETDDEWVEKED